MFNKNFLNIPQQNIENDPIISQLKKADYFIEVDSFKYSYYSGRWDTYYDLYDFNIVKHSNTFEYPWKITNLSIYSLSTFDICYSPNIGIASNNLIIGNNYFGVVYINKILIYTERSDGASKTTISSGVDGITGETKWCTSKVIHGTPLSYYFDTDIHPNYPENIDINIPLFVAFYKDAVPNEIVKISNNKDNSRIRTTLIIKNSGPSDARIKVSEGSIPSSIDKISVNNSLSYNVYINYTFQITVSLGSSSDTWGIVELSNCELINDFNKYNPADIKITGENPRIIISYMNGGSGSN